MDSSTASQGSPRSYRKRPVVIDAVQWTGGNSDEVLAFMFSDERWKAGLDDGGMVGGPGIGYIPPLRTFDIPTLEGTMTAQVGDWIIRGVKGELYPCKPDIFEATYEPELDDDEAKCEGCSGIILYDDAHFDAEGCALCDDCWTSLLSEEGSV